MSNEKQHREDLRREVYDLFKYFERHIFDKDGRLDHLFRSGAIDFSQRHTGTKLPRQILIAIAHDMSGLHRPLRDCNNEFDRDVDNLRQHL
ncbi:hypothetical protein [Endozoicomonas atrinae]|uniref:hypothetical protein n=1 Tax=Endozoicomonas atrinae TaxID=1333660 RepID=UPI000825504C|nr:hypothetical protein [Endozoicomonas atrinae]